MAQLVARLTGGQEAACSSHVTPTNLKSPQTSVIPVFAGFFVCFLIVFWMFIFRKKRPFSCHFVKNVRPHVRPINPCFALQNRC